MLAAITTFPFDHAAGARAAHIRAHLESKGTAIGAYDLLIAGHALDRGLTPVTHNTLEFNRVPGLHLEDWVA